MDFFLRRHSTIYAKKGDFQEFFSQQLLYIIK